MVHDRNNDRIYYINNLKFSVLENIIFAVPNYLGDDKYFSFSRFVVSSIWSGDLYHLGSRIVQTMDQNSLTNL